MAERYNKLYTLPGNLYAVGSPVLISAGALLKDSQTGKVLCQLKFKNISPRVITALKVLVIGYDMSDEEVCRAEHQYLDLKVQHNGSFGSKEAIPLPDNSVRSYTARVLSVHFEDGSRHASAEENWQPMPELEQLSQHLFDKELIRQYKLETSPKSEYIPMSHKDIWFFSCGEINPRGEKCSACNMELADLQFLLNVELLTEKRNARLLEESRQAAQRQSSRSRSAKIIKIILAILIPLLLAGGVAYYMYDRALQREVDYESAAALLAAENYAEAAAAYDALGDYKDSAQKAESIRAILSEINSYDKALKFLENGRYDDAREAFLSLGNFEDAAQLADEALYKKANELIDKNQLEDARALFTELSDYKDSAALVSCFVERLSQEETSYNAECEGPLLTSYTYDDMGRIAVKTEHFSAYPGLYDRVLQYSWNGDGSRSVTEYNTVREYDTWGILLSENGVSKYVYDYGYHDNGNLKYYGAYSPEDESFLFEQVYDEKGNPIRYSDAQGNTSTTNNEYDESGLLIKQENFNSENAFVDRTSFEYDELGRLKRSTYMDLNNVSSVTNYSYTLIFAPGLKAQ